MRDWIPVSTSPKGRLVLAAIGQFRAHEFDEVTVGALAAEAGVTTGALYHHFGNKLGLYEFVRADIEQRMLDRLEGAIAARPSGSDSSTAVTAALLVAFDFAVGEGFLRLLGAPPAGLRGDRLAEALSTAVAPASAVLGPVLAAAWRAALAAIAGGAASADARAAVATLHLRIPSGD